MDKTVGILIPVYNAVGFIERCIKSILNQTYQNIKVFIIDDGSTDETYALCKAYAESDSHMFVQYNMLWGKLFPISLFYNVKFLVGLNMVYFEDGATTFKLIYEAKEVRYSPEQLYYIVGKADSMTRKPITEKKIEDSLLPSEAAVLFYSGKGET